MKTLLTKVQYRNYEPGEFTDISHRSYEETVALVNVYDWQGSRDILSAEATGPSIAIEGTIGILKLGVYHNGQFILRLLTKENTLYERIVETLSEAIDFVQAMYDETLVPSQLFRMPGLGMRKHFVTNSFIYRVTWKRIIQFNLIYNFSVGSLWMFVVVLAFKVILEKNPSDIYWAFLPLLVWFFLFGVNWVVFINYYLHERNKLLILSRGQNVFQYGTKDNLRTYYKSDTAHITSLTYQGMRNPYNGNDLYTIYFKNGEQLQFTNLLFPGDLNFKLSPLDISEVKTYFPKLIKKQR